MYSKQFWDDIYLNHYFDAPWMDDGWKNEIFNILENDIAKFSKKSNKPLRLLDYGCGNGHMGYYFFKKGMKVDIADISEILINRLKNDYKDEKGFGIYQTNSPIDLPKRQKYDVIIAWNLFHHIHPQHWKIFIKEFLEKTKAEGTIYISGWDQEDDTIKMDHNKARYTNHSTWYINDLPNYIDDFPCKILTNTLLQEFVPTFNSIRKFRYIVIQKSDNDYKLKTK